MSLPSIAEVTAALTAPGEQLEMEERTIRGVTVRVGKYAPITLRAIIERSLDHGDRDFLVYENEHLSFPQHAAAAAHLAGILRDRFGVTKGDRVAIAMRNLPEWSIAFFAAATAGAIVVPL